MAGSAAFSRSWFRSRVACAGAGGVAALGLVGIGGAMSGRGALNNSIPSEYARLRINQVNAGFDMRAEYVLSLPEKSYSNGEIAVYLELEDTWTSTAILNEMADRGWALASHSMAGVGGPIGGGGDTQPVTEEYIFAR